MASEVIDGSPVLGKTNKIGPCTCQYAASARVIYLLRYLSKMLAPKQ